VQAVLLIVCIRGGDESPVVGRACGHVCDHSVGDHFGDGAGGSGGGDLGCGTDISSNAGSGVGSRYCCDAGGGTHGCSDVYKVLVKLGPSCRISFYATFECQISTKQR